MSTKKKEEHQNLPINQIRQRSAPKLSPKSTDELTYEIGIHAETKQLHLRIASNGTGGYFSDEWIPVETIEKCFDATFNKAKPFSSTRLRPVFAQGKSANNAGFLAAVLRQEQLISPHESNCFQHLLTGDFDKWKHQVISELPKKSSKASEQVE
ncbi:hypothetical protein [Neptunomonas qingdaonensis]|uniref:Uncharacterized protein n=1 Tax=Neptunomonas qingdaonensis TaxID=1045558 RepID=A0A1I2N212_9GAMM|nr:hypothetical protein [Neptunomonas qingdaonensis]SFF95777.1 hypothetical protein SAMN05216175_102138 [Neptunomonas qingdaonensis]